MVPVVILPLKKFILSPLLIALSKKFSAMELHRTKEGKHMHEKNIINIPFFI
jgi:hypothetical protein